MLIVRTIPDTVRYHTEINKQLKEKGIHNKIKTLIGFSGTTDYNGEEITENYINKENGFDGSDIPEGFKNPKYIFAGKTGSSQIKRFTEAQREAEVKQTEIDYLDRDHALFIAFAPYDNPSYAISVVVEHGGTGSLSLIHI